MVFCQNKRYFSRATVECQFLQIRNPLLSGEQARSGTSGSAAAEAGAKMKQGGTINEVSKFYSAV